MSCKKITLVTGNQKKLEEFREILGPNFLDKIDNKNIDLPEFQGEPKTIAKEKCKLAANILKGPVLVEDTSLCFNAMGGMPGPYIKWFLESIGNEGIVKMLEGFDDKTAHALCVFAYSSGTEGEGEPEVVYGECKGTIVAPRGSTKFGWDPIFLPDDSDKTFAEMEIEEKNKISHRHKALVELGKLLRSKNI